MKIVAYQPFFCQAFFIKHCLKYPAPSFVIPLFIVKLSLLLNGRKRKKSFYFFVALKNMQKLSCYLDKFFIPAIHNNSFLNHRSVGIPEGRSIMRSEEHTSEL